MPDYIFLMHRDAPPTEAADWVAYIERLQKAGVFQGGSAIGAGACMNREGGVPPTTDHLTGYMRVTADDLEHARRLVIGNPAYEAGGTVEIRELPEAG